MLVLGRIHVVAQRVGRLPQLRLKAERRAVIPCPGITAVAVGGIVSPFVSVSYIAFVYAR
jgi:hypothetical protein